MIYIDDIMSCLGVYSLRQAAAGYTGPVVWCVCKTDSGYKSEKFTASEVEDISDWSEGFPVYVYTWYNQVGGPDLVQDALEAQPVIAFDGKLFRRNNRPMILQRSDGSLDASFSLGFDPYVASFVGGADYIVPRPTLFELPMVRTTMRRRVVTRRDGVWSYLGKKYLSEPIGYGDSLSGYTHTIRHVGNRVEAWHSGSYTEAEGTDPAETNELTVLNSKRGEEQGGYLAEFVIATGNVRTYQARQMHLWQKGYYG